MRHHRHTIYPALHRLLLSRHIMHGSSDTSFRFTLSRPCQLRERHPVSIGEVNKSNVSVAAAIPATQHALALVFSTGRYAVLDELLVRNEVIAAGGGGWRHAEYHARNGETGMAWHPVAVQLLPALCDRSRGRTDRELADVANRGPDTIKNTIKLWLIPEARHNSRLYARAPWKRHKSSQIRILGALQRRSGGKEKR